MVLTSASLHEHVAVAAESTGIAKQLKSELRFRLIRSLQKASHLKALDEGDSRLALPEKAIFSVILEFLRSRKKDCSISVLLPESGMAAADVLTPEEVCQALSLPKAFGQCKTEAFLVRALESLSKPEQRSAGTQTESKGIGQNLEEKLQACIQPTDKADRRTAEERMLQFQARCEAIVRKEAEAELARIRMLEREQIALEEAAKSRAELQEAMLKLKGELSEREERLRQRERLAADRLRAKELEMEKKAVEWRETAQRVIHEEQQRQSTRGKHLDVEEKRLQILKEGLERKEHELKHVEERNAVAAGELSRRIQEAQESATLSAEKAVAAEREELLQLRLTLEREKLQIERSREQLEADQDRLTAEAERSAIQARDIEEAEERIALQTRELEDAKQRYRDSGGKAADSDSQLEKTALQQALTVHKEALILAEGKANQLQQEVERLQSRLQPNGGERAVFPDDDLKREWWMNAVRRLQDEILSGFSSDDGSEQKVHLSSRKRTAQADFKVSELQQEKLRLSSEVDGLRRKLSRFEALHARDAHGRGASWRNWRRVNLEDMDGAESYEAGGLDDDSQVSPRRGLQEGALLEEELSQAERALAAAEAEKVKLQQESAESAKRAEMATEKLQATLRDLEAAKAAGSQQDLEKVELQEKLRRQEEEEAARKAAEEEAARKAAEEEAAKKAAAEEAARKAAAEEAARKAAEEEAAKKEAADEAARKAAEEEAARKAAADEAARKAAEEEAARKAAEEDAAKKAAAEEAARKAAAEVAAQKAAEEEAARKAAADEAARKAAEEEAARKAAEEEAAKKAAAEEAARKAAAEEAARKAGEEEEKDDEERGSEVSDGSDFALPLPDMDEKTPKALALGSSLVVKSYGILGRSSKEQKANPPDEHTVLVDPAGLPFICDKGPKDAKGASQANYLWLGISEAETFPQEVKAAITKECKAKYYAYAGGKKKCIHVVGPDLRHPPDGGGYSLDEAVDKLAVAYRNVFEEFSRVGMQHGLRRMRLLPISGGIFSGDFKDNLPEMTAQALHLAFDQLSEDEKQHIVSSSIEMCIFMESEFDVFASAFEQGPGASKVDKVRREDPEEASEAKPEVQEMDASESHESAVEVRREDLEGSETEPKVQETMKATEPEKQGPPVHIQASQKVQAPAPFQAVQAQVSEPIEDEDDEEEGVMEVWEESEGGHESFDGSDAGW